MRTHDTVIEDRSVPRDVLLTELRLQLAEGQEVERELLLAIVDADGDDDDGVEETAATTEDVLGVLASPAYSNFRSIRPGPRQPAVA